MPSASDSPWVEKYSEKHKKPYWKHKTSGETVWKNPTKESAKADTGKSVDKVTDNSKAGAKANKPGAKDAPAASLTAQKGGEAALAVATEDTKEAERGSNMDSEVRSSALQSLPDVGNVANSSSVGASVDQEYVLTPFELCQYVNKLEDLSNSPGLNKGFWMYLMARDDDSSLGDSAAPAEQPVAAAPAGEPTTSSQMFAFRSKKAESKPIFPSNIPAGVDVASFSANVYFVQLHWHHAHVNEYCVSYTSYDAYRAKFPKKALYNVGSHFPKPPAEVSPALVQAGDGKVAGDQDANAANGGGGGGDTTTATAAGTESATELKAAAPVKLASTNVSRFSQFFTRSKSVGSAAAAMSAAAVETDENVIKLGPSGSFVISHVSNLTSFDKTSGFIPSELVTANCSKGCSLYITERSVIPTVPAASATTEVVAATAGKKDSEQDSLDAFDRLVLGPADSDAVLPGAAAATVSATIKFSATKIIRFIPLDNNNVIAALDPSAVEPTKPAVPAKAEGEPAAAADAAVVLVPEEKIKSAALSNANLNEAFVDAVTACIYLCKLFAASRVAARTRARPGADAATSLLVANISGAASESDSIFVGLRSKYLHRHKPIFSGIDSVIQKVLGCPATADDTEEDSPDSRRLSRPATGDYRLSVLSEPIEPPPGSSRNSAEAGLGRYSYRSDAMRFNPQSGRYEALSQDGAEGQSRFASMRHSAVYSSVSEEFLRPVAAVEDRPVEDADKGKKKKGMLHKLRKMTSFSSLNGKNGRSSPGRGAGEAPMAGGRVEEEARYDRKSDGGSAAADIGLSSPAGSRSSLRESGPPESRSPEGKLRAPAKATVDLSEYHAADNKYRLLSPYAKRPDPVAAPTVADVASPMPAPVTSPRHPGSAERAQPLGLSAASALGGQSSSAVAVGAGNLSPYGNMMVRSGPVKRLYAVPGGSSVANAPPAGSPARGTSPAFGSSARGRLPPPAPPAEQPLRVVPMQPEPSFSASGFSMSALARSPARAAAPPAVTTPAPTTPAPTTAATPESGGYVGSGRPGAQDVDMSARSDNLMYALYEPPGAGGRAELVQLAFVHNGLLAKRKCNGIRIANSTKVFVALKLKDVFEAEYDQTATGPSATGLFRLQVRCKGAVGTPNPGCKKSELSYLVLQCVCPLADGSGYDNAAVFEKLHGWLSKLTRNKAEYMKKHTSPGLSLSSPGPSLSTPVELQLPTSPGVGSPEVKLASPIKIHYSEKVVPDHAPPEVVETLKRTNSMMPFYHAKKAILADRRSQSPPKRESPSRREAQGFVYDSSNYRSTITESNPTHVSKHNRNVSPSSRARVLSRSTTGTSLGGAESPGPSVGASMGLSAAALRAEDLSLSPSGRSVLSGATSTSGPIVGPDGQPIARNLSPGARARAKARERSESGSSPVSASRRIPSPARPRHMLKTGSVAKVAAPPEDHPLTEVLHNNIIPHTYDPTYVNLSTLDNVDSSLVVGAKGKKKYQQQLYSTLYKINPSK